MKDNHAEIPKDMYKDHVLELYKSPRNLGTLKKPTYEHTEQNSICGDEITIQLLIKGGKVQDAKFSGSGCVISIVSSSMLMDKLKGMPLKEINKLTKKDLLDLLKIKVTPARIKCALLSLKAMKNAIKE
ncbi:MAG: iron-sulfur cluster assembly scaffold protein [Nanoarchaeota archaeon]|nr:iron-sulfur cluster assembly scaffold protein [Nanoarchaeota archaeon]